MNGQKKTQEITTLRAKSPSAKSPSAKSPSERSPSAKSPSVKSPSQYKLQLPYSNDDYF